MKSTFVLVSMLLMSASSFAEDRMAYYPRLANQPQNCPQYLMYGSWNQYPNSLIVSWGNSFRDGRLNTFAPYGMGVDRTAPNGVVRCGLVRATHDGNIFDYDRTVCTRVDFHRDGGFDRYTCERGNAVFGAGGECNPVRDVERRSRGAVHYSASFAMAGKVVFSSLTENFRCEYSSNPVAPR